MEEHFRKIAQHISKFTGSVWTFFTAVFVIILWALSGPFLNYSNTWQLTINTMTTVVTFLMVFLIQNTQNRDTKTMHIKLDELIRAVKGTRPKILDTDQLSDVELEELHQEFVKKSQQYAQMLERRKDRLSTKNGNDTPQ